MGSVYLRDLFDLSNALFGNVYLRINFNLFYTLLGSIYLRVDFNLFSTFLSSVNLRLILISHIPSRVVFFFFMFEANGQAPEREVQCLPINRPNPTLG